MKKEREFFKIVFFEDPEKGHGIIPTFDFSKFTFEETLRGIYFMIHFGKKILNPNFEFACCKKKKDDKVKP